MDSNTLEPGNSVPPEDFKALESGSLAPTEDSLIVLKDITNTWVSPPCSSKHELEYDCFFSNDCLFEFDISANTGAFDNIDCEYPLDLTKPATIEIVPQDEIERAKTSQIPPPDPDFCASETEGVEEITDPGPLSRSFRPSRGRKRKIPTQTIKGSKLLRQSNENYHTYKNKLIEKKIFQDYRCQRTKKKEDENLEEDGVLDLSKPHNQEETEENLPCMLNCPEKLSTSAKETIFNKFWALKRYESQNLFICSNVSERPTYTECKRNNFSTSKRKKLQKKFTRVYTLNGLQVCRETFVNTLQVSTKRVNTALKKHRSLTLNDNRGMSQSGFNKLNEDQREAVRNHIRKFPRYKSHYRRSQTDSEFLAPTMNLVIMYDLYVEDLIGENNRDKIEEYRAANTEGKKLIVKSLHAVSLSTYKRIFYEDFNLKFKSLKKDTCSKCDCFAAKLVSATGEERELIEKEQAQHLQAVESARNELKNDTDLSKSLENFQCVTFDLEKTLPLPRIPSNIVFYKRQLWLYNSGIHSCKDDQGYFYVWTENQAGRGAQEIGSALLKHFKKNLGDNITNLVLWADSCGGQNRNIKIVLLMRVLFESFPSLETVTFKYLVSGHSFLPNDTDFSDVEGKLKFSQRLYLPEEYLQIMRNARHKKPFIVTRMEPTDFFTSKDLEKLIVNRRDVESVMSPEDLNTFIQKKKEEELSGKENKDEETHKGRDKPKRGRNCQKKGKNVEEPEKEKINWLHLREIKSTRYELYKMYCRTDFNSAYKVVDLQRTKGKNKLQGKSFGEALKLGWPDGKGIAPAKLKDLESLLHLIPDDAKPFYTNLIGNNEMFDDIDGFCIPLDFEEDEHQEQEI